MIHTTEYRYFCDAYGTPVQLKNIDRMQIRKAVELFPGVKGLRVDSFSIVVGKTPDGIVVPATRRILYKIRPSLHKCSAKCRNGKCGGVCECSCGGVNHGLPN
jgi:hypothetical protein